MLGILLIRKPAGITSHDVVNDVRRKFGTKRVGHAGTLDPMATGLLVVAVGPATRFLQYLQLEPKEYEATISFGTETDSYDAEGRVISQTEIPEDLPARVASALPAFLGLIQQIPPMFSAIKVQGKPLYRYAREGQELRREARTVHIGAFEVIQSGPAEFRARIECSGGTYVRSLAHDLGQAVGTGAHLSALDRSRVGRFHADSAVELSAVTPEDIIPLREALHPMPQAVLNESEVRQIREGRTIPVRTGISEPLVALCELDGSVFSVARAKGEVLQPECVIPGPMRLEDAVNAEPV